MKEHSTRQPERKDGVTSKKDFVKPELHREAKLPRIANAHIGSFNP